MRRDEIEGVLHYVEGWLSGANLDEASRYLREPGRIAEIADQYLEDHDETRTVVYIAGPMTGMPGKNYAAFMEAEEQLREAGYVPLNPVRVDDDFCDSTCPMAHETDEDHHWTWYMRRALAMLTQAHAIALLPGWEASRGVEVEKFIAHALDMDALPLEMWLEEEKRA